MSMLLYNQNITPRLRYIAGFIGQQIFGRSFEVTNDRDRFARYDGPSINYSGQHFGKSGFRIEDCGLLSQSDIRDQSIDVFDNGETKAFFKTAGDYPFDIFAASFYLLSRYEEYLPHPKDKYGRFAHTASLAWKEGFLHLPIINFWLADFREKLIAVFPAMASKLIEHRFIFQPTYDIDEAYSFKHKSWIRSAGGLGRALVTGRWSSIGRRIKVLRNVQQDPYDSFDWMDSLHQDFELQPVYFFHAGISRGNYDKNISPGTTAMQELIKRHSSRYAIGVHPSWKSNDDPELLKKEVNILAGITGKRITKSRQHYIRFTLPQTFRSLIAAGITDDYSMGYGSINGFRASIATAFNWYDLETETETNLLLHPFCFMDANAFFESGKSPEEAIEEMREYYTVCKSVKATMITIWHNPFFGTDPLFQGWKETYHDFLQWVRNH